MDIYLYFSLRESVQVGSSVLSQKMFDVCISDVGLRVQVFRSL